MSFEVLEKKFSILFPQRVDQKLREEMRAKLRERSSYVDIILFSSGTTSGATVKGYGLSFEALFSNAKAVNEHLGLDSRERWGLTLPSEHIGGLSVWARAKLSGSQVFEWKRPWNPHVWSHFIEQFQVTVTSLVPTQVFDLVHQKIQCPKCLSKVIVGGDYLSQSLHQNALKLGWPLLRTFGMTELCSQVATEKEVSLQQRLIPLSIHQLAIVENVLCVTDSKSLVSEKYLFSKGRLEVKEITRPFLTSDRVELRDGFLFHKGRTDRVIKMNGRLVDLDELNFKLYSLSDQIGIKKCFYLRSLESERAGKVLELMHLPNVSNKHIEAALKVLRPFKVDQLTSVSNFHFTELGKLRDKNL